MKIRSKLTLLILGTSLLLLPVISYIYYKNVSHTILQELYKHLESISQTKEIRLKDLIAKRYELITLFSTNKDLISRLKKDNSSIYNREDITLIKALNRYTKIIPSFAEINILSPWGIVLISSDSTNTGEDYSNHEVFKKALSGEKVWGDFHFNKEGTLSLYLAAPINSGGKLLGVSMIETNSTDILSLTSDYMGLGETGESVIGIREKDSTILINTLRFQRNKALSTRLNPCDFSIAMNRALNQEQGVIPEGKDYRNIDVIASIRYIEEVGWGMVTKIDRKEAYAPIHELMYLLWFINLFAVLTTCVIAFFGSSYLSKPIEQLKKSVDKMKEGDLSVRAEVKTADEIGILAKSYNEMAGSLQKKITDLDNFIYTASHDLKAPVSNIEGLIASLPDTVSKETQSDKEFLEIMGMITTSVNKFKSTIQDLTDISRIQNNLAEDVAYIDLCIVIEEAKDLLNQEISKTHAEINFDKSICPAIRYSSKDLKSIIYNLLSNAIKYKAPDRKPVITISTALSRDYTALIIEDNGLGIPKEKINQIYSMFKRLHDHVPGTGIGLYIVKRIVENNQGKIEVESNVGKGTIFKVYFKNQ